VQRVAGVVRHAHARLELVEARGLRRLRARAARVSGGGLDACAGPATAGARRCCCCCRSSFHASRAAARDRGAQRTCTRLSLGAPPPTRPRRQAAMASAVARGAGGEGFVRGGAGRRPNAAARATPPRRAASTMHSPRFACCPARALTQQRRPARPDEFQEGLHVKGPVHDDRVLLLPLTLMLRRRLLVGGLARRQERLPQAVIVLLPCAREGVEGLCCGAIGRPWPHARPPPPAQRRRGHASRRLGATAPAPDHHLPRVCASLGWLGPDPALPGPRHRGHRAGWGTRRCGGGGGFAQLYVAFG
jgi:hypothetical protein